MERGTDGVEIARFRRGVVEDTVADGVTDGVRVERG